MGLKTFLGKIDINFDGTVNMEVMCDILSSYYSVNEISDLAYTIGNSSKLYTSLLFEYLNNIVEPPKLKSPVINKCSKKLIKRNDFKNIAEDNILDNIRLSYEKSNMELGKFLSYIPYKISFESLLITFQQFPFNIPEDISNQLAKYFICVYCYENGLKIIQYINYYILEFFNLANILKLGKNTFDYLNNNSEFMLTKIKERDIEGSNKLSYNIIINTIENQLGLLPEIDYKNIRQMLFSINYSLDEVIYGVFFSEYLGKFLIIPDSNDIIMEFQYNISEEENSIILLDDDIRSVTTNDSASTGRYNYSESEY